MIRLKLGTKFSVGKKEYEVVKHTTCFDCAFDGNEEVCDLLYCEGVMFKEAEQSSLVLAFKIIENVLMFRVLKQAKEWYNVKEGYILSRALPILGWNQLYIRGGNTDADNRICSMDFDTIQVCAKYYTDLVAKLVTECHVEKVVESSSWTEVTLTMEANK